MLRTFSRSLAFVACAALTAPATPLGAAPPLGGWKLEPSDARCVAVRQYGTSDKPITLALKAPLTEKTIQMAILRTGYRKSYVQTTATLKFDQQSFDTSALSYPLAGKIKRVTHLINLDSAQTTAIRTAKRLGVTVREGINDEFPLGETPAIWSELDRCTERLQAAWNIGAASRIASNPVGELQGLISADDYPVTAQREDQQGTTRFLILIDEKGLPRDCTLLGTSGSAVLDSRSCGLIMQRARFKPALDQTGKPAKSSWIQAINWRLEG